MPPDAIATRLTFSKNTGVPHSMVRYATVPPTNLDCTLALVDEIACYALINLTTMERTPLEFFGDSHEPLWSKNQADTFYYHTATRLMKYNVATREHSQICDEVFQSITFKGEGDIQCDKIACLADGRDVFLFDLTSRTMSPRYDTEGRPLDSIYACPDGSCLISWGISGTGHYQGVWLFSSEMKRLRQLTTYCGHKDVTVDSAGEPVMVITNNNTNAVMKVPLSGAPPTTVLPKLDWGLAVNISCPEQGDFAIISVYGKPLFEDAPFAGEILQVPFTLGPLKRLAYHRSTASGKTELEKYTRQPKAAVSADGNLVMWNSDNGDETGPVDVYFMRLDAPEPEPPQPPPPIVKKKRGFWGWLRGLFR